MSTLTFGHKTDVGRARKMNQDSLAVIEADGLDRHADGLFIVADGMGGMAGGEVASRLTIETVPAVVRETLAESNGAAGEEAMADAVREAIAAANEAVWKQARANPELRGMGTTCVTALVCDSVAVVGNVGDSRMYLLREGELTQLTQDHSLVQEHVRMGTLSREEARASRYRNVITRAVGIAGEVAPDVEVITLREGDTLLLCSDGLTNMVSEPEIARALAAIPDPQQVCEHLVAAANENGGEDNITTVVVRHGTFVPLDIPLPPPEEAEERTMLLDEPREKLADLSAGIRVGIFSYLLLVTLVLLLGGTLLYVGREDYEMTPAFPFVRHRNLVHVPKPRVEATVKPDFGSLVYGSPEMVLNKPVRGAPIACDAAGNVYVTTLQGKIFRVTSDGELTGDFGPAVKQPREIAPTHWAADSQGYLYIASKADHAIHKYDPNGTRKAVIAAGELQWPEGVAVDGSGNIYVVDMNRLMRIRAFPPEKTEGEKGGVESRESTPNHPITQLPNVPLSVEKHRGAR